MLCPFDSPFKCKCRFDLNHKGSHRCDCCNVAWKNEQEEAEKELAYVDDARKEFFEESAITFHTCEGLTAHYEYKLDPEQTCVPYIDRSLIVRGCDNSNDVKISFCPFCGERLANETS